MGINHTNVVHNSQCCLLKKHAHMHIQYILLYTIVKPVVHIYQKLFICSLMSIFTPVSTWDKPYECDTCVHMSQKFVCEVSCPYPHWEKNYINVIHMHNSPKVII